MIIVGTCDNFLGCFNFSLKLHLYHKRPTSLSLALPSFPPSQFSSSLFLFFWLPSLQMEDSHDTQSGFCLVSKAPKKVPVSKPLVRSKTLDALFPASSQDWIPPREQENIDDDNSSGEAPEACKNKLESEEYSSTKTPDLFVPPKSHFRWKKLLKTWKQKSFRHLSSKNSVKKICNKVVKRWDSVPALNAKMCKMKSSWRIFSFSEIQKATNSFSKENLIGKGGFAEVYMGCLKGGQLVAVKTLTTESHEERVKGFLSELGIIAHVDHPNTAKLIGYGVEGGLFIVLQLSSLGSLGSFLHGSKKKVEWRIRYKIALGTADGLLYLHEDCQRRIIHRDIKSDNILLTENYDAQICDFGLAMWLPNQLTHQYISKFEGTFGYFAPEYFMHGIVDEKTDVYAFGVLLLELITGRRAFNSENQSVLLWAKPFLDDHDLKSLVDPVLGNDYDEEELDCMVLTASLCTQQAPVLRPRMNQVAILLRGDNYSDKSMKGSQTQTIRRTFSEELLDAKEYNATKQLNDIRHLRQVAFAAIE